MDCSRGCGVARGSVSGATRSPKRSRRSEGLRGALPCVGTTTAAQDEASAVWRSALSASAAGDEGRRADEAVVLRRLRPPARCELRLKRDNGHGDCVRGVKQDYETVRFDNKHEKLDSKHSRPFSPVLCTCEATTSTLIKQNLIDRAKR